jgi:hypothetical protein
MVRLNRVHALIVVSSSPPGGGGGGSPQVGGVAFLIAGSTGVRGLSHGCGGSLARLKGVRKVSGPLASPRLPLIYKIYPFVTHFCYFEHWTRQSRQNLRLQQAYIHLKTL